MNKYHTFFIESEEGQKFVTSLHDMIEAEHRKAEQSPEMSIAHTQRACGIRQVVDKISAMSVDAKKVVGNKERI